jgi:hypothetical protein
MSIFPFFFFALYDADCAPSDRVEDCNAYYCDAYDCDAYDCDACGKLIDAYGGIIDVDSSLSIIYCATYPRFGMYCIYYPVRYLLNFSIKSLT